jgi:hypothetical protein
VATPARLGLLGVLVPATIACACAADIVLRLLPHDVVSFRAWEAVRTPGEAAPFLPNHRYVSGRTYGNLAAVGNLPEFRQYRPLTFTTDELGYPNPPGLARRGGVAAIVFGSSFAAGAELGDGLTLAAQLAALSGRQVYNAGGGDPGPADIIPLARRLVVPGGRVIVEYPEGEELPPLTVLHVTHKTARCRELLAPHGLERVCPWLGWLGRHVRVSPLAVLCQRAVKRLQDGTWMPNPYARWVLRERLRNREAMLFLAGERSFFHTGAAADPAVRYFRWLGAKLAAAHFSLLVVLVPRKYTVYAPLLATPDPGPEASVRYLGDLESRLNAEGIAVVNLTPPFRAAAETSLARGSYIYFPDDTHWNAAGAGLAAREIGRVWPALPAAR